MTYERAEPDIRQAVAARLRANGVDLAERVTCAAGTPDLVTADGQTIYEIKYRLTRKALFMAVGQVLLYCQALNPDARAIIVGQPTDELPALLPFITALGVEVVCWNEAEPAAPPRRITLPEPIQRTSYMRRPDDATTLAWNVAALAQARGITSVPMLGLRLGVQRQGLYGLWNGTARQISLEMLERLVIVLEADPGEWFGVGTRDWGLGTGERGLATRDWPSGTGERGAGMGEAQNAPRHAPSHYPSSHPSPQSPVTIPHLHWRIAEAAQARGLTIHQVSFQAQVYRSSLDPIWSGQAQAVSPLTLGKLARTLDRPDAPFAIGTLFTWRSG